MDFNEPEGELPIDQVVNNLKIPWELMEDVRNACRRYGVDPKPTERVAPVALKQLLIDCLAEKLTGKPWYGSPMQRIKDRGPQWFTR